MQMNKKKNAFQKEFRPIMIKEDRQHQPLYLKVYLMYLFLSLNRTAINQRLSANGRLHFIPGAKL